MTMNGIDISNWQKGLDLSKIKFDFVIIKATEGIGYVDKECDGFYQQAKKLNKKIGFYHFARPRNDAVKEAQFFYENTKAYFDHAIPVLDWEAENKQDTEWAKRWLDEVYRLSGVKPWIYMSEYVENTYNWSAVAKAGYELWIAKYRDNSPDYNYDMSNAGTRPTIKWWDSYVMWQWTSSGRLSGYNGNLDCDIFYGDKSLWDAYAVQAQKKPSNKLDSFTDEELADRVIQGLYGNGDARRTALGKRYDAVQAIVNKKLTQGQKTLKVGSKIKIKAGAKDLNTKKPYASFVYKNTYTVKEIKGDRVTFGTSSGITGATSKNNVKVV